MGFRLGFNAGYPLTKSLMIGRLQFNVSKYDIRLILSRVKWQPLHSITADGANYRFHHFQLPQYSNGSKADWLHNFYFSASVPVGLELKLTGNNKTYFGIIGTVQPTYILSDRAYLISTDYKNYAEVPSLTRKWNMSTGFEIYAGYTTGKINWRIGPRYVTS